MYNTWMRRIFDPKGKRLTTRAEQLRQTIEELGPTFVKFGQIVADRPDLASDHLREEIRKHNPTYNSAISIRLSGG